MANTVSIQSGVTVRGTPTFTFPNQTTQVSMAGNHIAANVQDIPTTAGGTQIAIEPGVATAGLAVFDNLDPTNYVDIGVQVSGTFYPLVRLLPGDPPAQFRLSTLTFYALAHTATVSVQYAVLEA